MTTFLSPRLAQMLRLLAQEKRPLSVDRLAQEVGASRRTVFRELDGIETVLQRVGLTLETVPGEGLLLSGPAEGFAALAALLGKTTGMSPQNKSDRRFLLLFLLMDAEGVQKLYYYAQLLGVSEATVSTDLDKIEEYLARFSLALVRRPALGVEVVGTEADFRRVLADLHGRVPNLRAFSRDYGYPSLQMLDAVGEILAGEWAPKLDWMTDESIAMLALRLSLMAERVKRRRVLSAEAASSEAVTGLAYQMAEQLCDTIESRFSLSLPKSERTAAGTFIHACRAKHLNPLDVHDAAAYTRMQNMAYRMIDAFDPRLSASLKMNEDLIHGLSLHLWSAVVRLKKGIELTSVMQDQLVRDFPDVFAKSRQAARVLEQEIGVPVPDSEIAFIASHFGAALMHYGERSSHHVVLRAGIVCVFGIGVSYMMASQVRTRFRGQLEVEVSDCNNPGEWTGFDLLISSMPLENAPCPVVVVKPVLEAQDFAAIRTVMEQRSAADVLEIPKLFASLPQQLEKTAARLIDMSAMLRGFSRQTIHADCTFEELAKMTGYRFGSEEESGGQIYADLLRRESVSSQVIENLEIILLHSRTAGVKLPVVGLISPKGPRFTHPSLAPARGCLVMLVPQNSDKDLLEIFGCLSGALIEDETLLRAVQSGDEPVAYARIEAALLLHLKNYWNEELSI